MDDTETAGRSDITAAGEDAAVVVPAISVPSSVACLRSLGRRGISTIAVSELDRPPAFQSAYCDETVAAPSPHQNLSGYRDALLALAARPEVVTVVPVREEDIYTLATNRTAFAAHVGTPWPDLETLAAVQDRVALFDVAADAGVAAPDTRLLEREAARDGEWIVKSRYALLADAYLDSYPADRCAAPATTRYLPPGSAPDVDALVEEMGHVPLLQEHVPTREEYGFFAIYDRGEALATFQHRQRRGYSYAGGASAFRESIQLPALEEAGRALLDALEWHGVAMVEFLRDEETGEFLLMEVNPRFWSSLPFSVRAGADFPAYYWQLATGNTERIAGSYDVGVAGHLIRGELLHLRSILVEDNDLVATPSFAGTLRDIVRSMVAHPRFDYLTRDDPRPFVRDMAIALGELRDRLRAAHLPGERPTRSGEAEHAGLDRASDEEAPREDKQVSARREVPAEAPRTQDGR